MPSSNFDPLQLYFNAISAIKPLSKQEVAICWKKSKKDKKAFHKLVEQNYKLVIPIAKRFMKKGIDFMDLIEEGNMGLIKAVEKFDTSKNIAFSTYAVYWVEQYMRKAIENQTKTIRIPSHMWDALNLWMKTYSILKSKLNREPTVAEIAEKLKLNKKQISGILKASAVFNGTTSIETPIGDDEEVFVKDTLADDKIKSPESVTEIIRTRDDITTALNYLPVREREIVRMRFGLGGIKPMSLEDIGKLLKISRERVRQLEIRSFKKLKGIFIRFGLIDKFDAGNILLDNRRSRKDRRDSGKKYPKNIDRRKNKDRRA
ncbi:sigma-70 family RNA polymerase sigma factor [Endomicrobium proavitum]|uniref:RNA polymerase sigma factor n=1 Tax=Endomicrobium proavitum TaxID=1408281 RepID=A0A0G3WJW4_9BACT|nr:RNA polymerase sigma factor RpoD/SigA [Endomicrobium proavitum]AKL97794.1 RNA polymerase sigma factor [Endomicrobium proavitum]